MTEFAYGRAAARRPLQSPACCLSYPRPLPSLRPPQASRLNRTWRRDFDAYMTPLAHTTRWRA
jgi:hypothetical protein